LTGKDENHPPEENWPRFFHLAEVPRNENLHLVIKVAYSNGETFENEVLID
jgi:hypothetical protein